MEIFTYRPVEILGIEVINAMSDLSYLEKNDSQESRLLKAVEVIAISPQEAKRLVAQFHKLHQQKYPTATEHERQDYVARLLIKRHARIAGWIGGTTALTGVIPGIGTAIAILGGASADMALTMKVQVDMCMCLAENYGYDINSHDARNLAFLIAAGSTLQQAGVEGATVIGSKAGVKMLQQYLKGSTLIFVKEMFKRVGITFTRKALEKVVPFGVGVAIGSSANALLVKYVGGQAMDWFVIDRDQIN
jgi:hypothetical protein